MSQRLLRRLKRDRDTDAYYWWRRHIREIKKDPTWFLLNVVFFLYMAVCCVFLVYLGYELFFGAFSVWRDQ